MSLAIPAVAARRSPQQSALPRFDQADADVWSARAMVTGKGAAQVTVNGRPVSTVNHQGRFRALVPLRIGPNRIAAVAPTGGVDHVTLRCRLSPRPTAHIHASRETHHTVTLSAGHSQPNPVTRAPITGYRWTDSRGSVLSHTATATLDTAGYADEQPVTLRIHDRDGAYDEAVVIVAAPSGNDSPVIESSYRPEWIDKAVVYGVVPPLFGVRPFQSVVRRLPRLAALGITVLWLAPVFRVAPGDYGYEVTDLFRIRPDYGSEAELRHLINAAHALDMRVILDLPVNDTSSRSRYYRQAERLGAKSHYYGFYDRDRHGRPEHYFDWRQLPNLNYDNPEVRAMVIDASLHWLDRLGHDGYRVDAAWGVQRRRPEFWATWTATLKRHNPSLLLLAEGTAQKQVWRRSGFDVAYDWTHELGQWAWHSAFGHADTAHRLRAILRQRPLTPPLRFLDNNDTGRRFITRYGAGATKAATAMLLTLPGLPELFTGSEIGAAYEPYQRTAPLDWHRDPHHLEGFHRRLIQRRHATPQLTGNGIHVLSALPDDPALSYLRTTHRGGEAVTVCINFSDRPSPVGVPGFTGVLPPWGHHIGSGHTPPTD